MRKQLLFLIVSIFFVNTYAQIDFDEHIIIDQTYSADGVWSVISTDIDGDGDEDVVATSLHGNEVMWFENIDGNGNFGPKQVVSSDIIGGRQVHAADVDGDGDIDLLSASNFDNKIAWYENLNGLGAFGSQQIISTNTEDARSVYTADIDGDGDLDALSASSDDNTIAWYENQDGLGDFGFQRVIHDNVIDTRSVFAADIDGDNDMDVLFASYFSDGIGWYENQDGLGDFSSPNYITFDADGAKLVLAEDVDNDGDMDALSASRIDGKVAWYENDGSGNFGTQQIILTIEDGADSVFMVDIDGDGDNDILTATSFDDTISWFENIDGLGAFGSQQIISNYLFNPVAVHASDLDNDGDMDVVSGSFNDDKIATYNNTNGLGNFGEQVELTTNVAGAWKVFSADIDGDGDMDALSASRDDDTVAWYENLNGLGNFGEQQIITKDAFYLLAINVADIDGDGDMDVLSTSQNDNKIAWYENLDGLGNFGPQQTVTTAHQNPFIVEVNDMDGDGDLDVISYRSILVFWIENMDGLGTFGTSHSVLGDNSGGIRSVHTADINGDGDIDILTGNDQDDTVTWSENDGLGNFGAPQIVSNTLLYFNVVHSSDIDGDGDIDILSGREDILAWHENLDGLGNFGAPQMITNQLHNTTSIVSEDMDGDGDLDVLTSSRSDNKIAWYENLDGLGLFGVQQLIDDAALETFSVFATDIDNDGDIDALSACFTNEKIAWYENLGVFSSNEINGTVQIDINANGCDQNDIAMENIMITTNNGTDTFSTFTLANGAYQLFTNEGDFTTRISSSLPTYFNSDPISHDSNFIGFGNTDTADFCAIPAAAINDLNISIYPIVDARPGFDAEYQIVYRNIGTTVLSGAVELDFDGTRLTLDFASEPVSSQTSNSLTFDYSNLNLFETRTINVIFEVATPPTTEIGDVLTFVGTVNPITGDNTENDNVISFNQTVVGSFDPNDIRVVEGPQILLENIDEYLHYIIRFQNTGTAEAVNINVTNELDANLDWETFQIETMSHDNRVEIVNGNQVNFIFDDINLPDSTTNEPESHGYIEYKIKPISSISIGDSMLNQASIYFDFNPPIVTNLVTTTVVEILGVNDSAQEVVSIYPNPTNGILYINSNTTIIKAQIYNQLGQLVFSENNPEGIDTDSINIKGLSIGLYFIILEDNKGVSNIQKILKK